MANWFQRFFNMDSSADDDGYYGGSQQQFSPPPMPNYQQPNYQQPNYQQPRGPIARAAGETIPVSTALRQFVRGALPPQGLAPFVHELRSTTDQVVDFYTSWTRYVWGDLVPRGLLEEPEARVERRRENLAPRPIQIDRNGGNGHSTVTTATTTDLDASPAADLEAPKPVELDTPPDEAA